MSYPRPANEAARLEALDALGIYGTGPEAGFDDLADLAAQITGAPLSMVNIVGDEMAWIKARHGVPPDLAEAPRGAVCCAHTICQSDLLWIPDTHADARVNEYPFIATEPFVRFYAGMPLIDSGGHALGTLCVMDLAPRELDFETAEALRRLGRQVVAQLELRIRLAEVERTQADLSAAKERAEALILNILPGEIARELGEHGKVEPRHHPAVTIMFTDFVNFTQSAERLAPRTLVDGLHQYFSDFDDIIAAHGLEKLKTIGDAYMCAGGLLGSNRGHAAETCLAALEIQRHVARANAERKREDLPPWELRIGIHTGSVMSGVVGKDKFTFDIWGDAVNVAARMESAGEAGRVNISDATWNRVKQWFDVTPRGPLEVRNKGTMPMYFLDRLKPDFAADADGAAANDAMRRAMSGVVAGWSLPPGKGT